MRFRTISQHISFTKSLTQKAVKVRDRLLNLTAMLILPSWASTPTSFATLATRAKSLVSPTNSLRLQGIISYLPTRTPLVEEIKNPEKVLHLTPSTDWNPHDKSWQQQEESILSFRGEIKEVNSKKKFIISSVISRTLETITFAEDILRRAQAYDVPTTDIYAVKMVDGSTSMITPQHLANC